MDADATTPIDIRIDKTRLLYIQWKDGHISRFPLGYLRKRCPCATCNDIRQRFSGEPPVPKQPSGGFMGLSVLPDAAPRTEGSAEIREANPMGHYALQFVWGDGHDSGIFSYEFLRAQSPGDPHQANEMWEGRPAHQIGEELERESREKNSSLWE